MPCFDLNHIMHKQIALYIFFALLGAMLPACANPGNTRGDDCRASVSESALLTCRENRFKASELALSHLLAEIRASASRDYPNSLKSVDAAVANWAPYRDAECAVLTRDSAGGRAYKSYLLACQEQMNRKRIDILQALIDNP